MKRVLFIRFSSIGDIVLCSAATRCFKSQYPELELHFLTKPVFSELCSTLPGVDHVHDLDDSISATIKKMKSLDFDLVVDLHNNIRSKRVSSALKKKTLRVDKRNIDKWLMVQFKAKKEIPHIALRYIQTMESIGVGYDDLGLELDIPARTEKEVSDTRTLAVAVGAKFGTKKIPASMLKEIVRWFQGDVILLGGKEDIKTAESLLVPGRNFRTENLCGKLSIVESAQALQSADVLLSGDTGLMHIGAAFKIPIVSVWGNTVPEFGMFPFFRKDENFKWSALQAKKLDCRPCSKIGFDQCPKGHFNCMVSINPETIKEAIVEKLQFT